MASAVPIACLTPTDTVPTRVYLTTIQTEINSNAISILSATSPTYRHLVLTVTPAIYISYGANIFSNHVNPGLSPIYEATTTSSLTPLKYQNCKLISFPPELRNQKIQDMVRALHL